MAATAEALFERLTPVLQSIEINGLKQASFLESIYNLTIVNDIEQAKQISLLSSILESQNRVADTLKEANEIRRDQIEAQETREQLQDVDSMVPPSEEPRGRSIMEITNDARESLPGIGKILLGALATPAIFSFMRGFVDELVSSDTFSSALNNVLPQSWVDSIVGLNIDETAKTGVGLAFSALLFGPIGLLKSGVTAAFLEGLEQITGFDIDDNFQAAFTALMGMPYSFTLARVGTGALMRGALGRLMTGALLNPVVLLAAGIGTIAYTIWERTQRALQEAEARNEALRQVGLDPEGSMREVLAETAGAQTPEGVYDDAILRMVRMPQAESILPAVTVAEAAARATGAQGIADIDTPGTSEIEDALAAGDIEKVRQLLADGYKDIISQEYYAPYTTHLNQLIDQLAELDTPYSPQGLTLMTQIADALSFIKSSNDPTLATMYNSALNRLRSYSLQGIEMPEMQSFINEDLSGADAVRATAVMRRVYEMAPVDLNAIQDEVSDAITSPNLNVVPPTESRLGVMTDVLARESMNVSTAPSSVIISGGSTSAPISNVDNSQTTIINQSVDPTRVLNHVPF